MSGLRLVTITFPTIIKNQNRKLVAKCGATKLTNSQYKPCNLNIDIDKGKVERKDILYESQKENINISTLTIIKLKLDLIFKYLSEEETLEKFDEIISEYETESEWINTLTQEMIQIANKLSNKPRIQAIKDENEQQLVIQYDGFEKALPPGNYNFASAKNQLILLNQKNPQEAYMVVLCGPFQYFNKADFNTD